jgi:glutamate-1-semialdehyde 2,1-aminomutase
MDSKQWFERAKAVMPGGVNSPVRAFGSVGGEPVYIVKGSGQTLWDVEGRQYLDMVGSWGPMILGHAHPDVEAAVILAVSHGASFGACCPAEVELAELVCTLVPSVEMVRMVSSGTEAVMSALRLARGYTGRDVVVKFDGCYHGHSDGLLSKAGSGLATQGLPGSAGVPFKVAAQTITLPYNDIDAVEALFTCRGGEIAAVIVEPVAANMGVVEPAHGFLDALRRITSRHNALLVFDEVITGFRLGISGAQGLYGVTPDLTTFGKIIGGGFPVGAYGGRRDVMQMVAPLGPVYQAGTLSGNPVAMAAGQAQLMQLAAHPEYYVRMEELGCALAQGAKAIADQYGLPLTVNRAGSLLTFFFNPEAVWNYRCAMESDTARYGRFFRHMLSQGIYFAPSQFEAAFLSAVHTSEDIARILQAFEDFVKGETTI